MKQNHFDSKEKKQRERKERQWRERENDTRRDRPREQEIEQNYHYLVSERNVICFASLSMGGKSFIPEEKSKSNLNLCRKGVELTIHNNKLTKTQVPLPFLFNGKFLFLTSLKKWQKERM